MRNKKLYNICKISCKDFPSLVLFHLLGMFKKCYAPLLTCLVFWKDIAVGSKKLNETTRRKSSAFEISDDLCHAYCLFIIASLCCNICYDGYFFSRIIARITIFSHLLTDFGSESKFVRVQALPSATSHIESELPHDFTETIVSLNTGGSEFLLHKSSAQTFERPSSQRYNIAKKHTVRQSNIRVTAIAKLTSCFRNCTCLDALHHSFLYHQMPRRRRICPNVTTAYELLPSPS